MVNQKRNIRLADYFIELNIIVMLFCLPFSKSMIEICASALIAAFLVKKLFLEKSLRVNVNRPALAFLCLFVLFNGISLFNSDFPGLSVPAFFSKVLKWALLFVVAADTIRRPDQARRIFRTMLFSCGLVLADGLYQYYLTGVDFLHYPERYPVFKFLARQQGTMSHPTACFPFPNDFAAWMNVYFLAFFAMEIFRMYKKEVYRIVLPLYLFVMSLFMLLTTSKGGVLGTGVSGLVLLVMNRRQAAARMFLKALAVVMLVIVVIPYSRSFFMDFFDVKLSLNDRESMWTTSWKIYERHPVLGNGTNTFFEHFKNYREDEYKYKKGSYAHNCYLQMMTETGAAGLTAFLMFCFFVLWTNMRKTVRGLGRFRGALGFGLGLGVIAFMAHSFFDTHLYSLNLAALFWLSMGLIEGISSYDQNEKDIDI